MPSIQSVEDLCQRLCEALRQGSGKDSTEKTIVSLPASPSNTPGYSYLVAGSLADALADAAVEALGRVHGGVAWEIVCQVVSPMRLELVKIKPGQRSKPRKEKLRMRLTRLFRLMMENNSADVIRDKELLLEDMVVLFAGTMSYLEPFAGMYG